MKICKIIFCYFLLITSQVDAQLIELDNNPQSASELKQSREMRDNTKAPNSWVGSGTESLARGMAELANQPKGTCFLIKDESWKNHCLANFEGRNSCFLIKDLNLKNHCIAQSEGRNGCFQIKSDNLKNHCLARSEGKSYCFLIKNDNIKNHCLARSEGKNACFNIKNRDLHNHCIAVH